MVKLVPDDLHSELTAHGLRCVASVHESRRATDHAVALSAKRLAVVRRVDRENDGDHTALATMIAQGDIIWGAIVYTDDAEQPLPGMIESFHVSQLGELVARLSEFREALHGAR